MRERIHLLVDDLGLAAALKVSLFALRYRVLTVRFVSARRAGTHIVRAMQVLGLIGPHEPINLDLTEQTPAGGPLREQVHLVVHEAALKLVARIRSQPSFVDFLPRAVSPERRQAYLEKVLRRDIYDVGILSCVYAQSKRNGSSPGGAQHEKDPGVRTVALVKLSDLSKLIGEVLTTDPDLVFRGYSGLRFSVSLWLCRFILAQAAGLLAPFRQLFTTGTGHAERATVAVQYSQGIDGTLFTDNDLWWYEHSELPPGRCLVLFDRPREPATDEVIRALATLGFRYRVLNRAANASSRLRTSGFPSKGFRHAVEDSSFCFRLLAAAAGGCARRWQLAEWLSLNKRLREWQALMADEGIRVLFSTEQSSIDMMSLAADLVGGIRAGFHWWAANYPIQTRMTIVHQVFFVWGRRYLVDAAQSQAGCPEYVLQSGCIFDDAATNPHFDETARALRARFETTGVRHVVGVLDRSLGVRGAYPAQQHVRFFDSLLSFAEANDSVGLLVKPKAVGGPAVLHQEPKLRARMKALESQGRVIVLDGKRYVAEAARAADVSVALGYNSGGFVAALAGGRCIFWDPAKLVGGPCGRWYLDIGWEEPQVVFHDMDALIEQLVSFLRSPATSPRFGDAGPLLEGMDPFRDGRAAERIGGFVGGFVRALDQGADRGSALDMAVEDYRNIWGSDAVLRPNVRETG